MSVAYRWRYLNDARDEISGPDETFVEQHEAEAWFTDTWPDLLDRGIHAVTLLESSDDGDREIYGPMGLHPAS